ncbi:MAG TPA: cobalamin-binding protein [Oscillatoriaceae cyanobacterium]
MFPAQRIVCLTEETVETLYLLGEQDRIVGISGFVVRPLQARKEKPRVSAFVSADIEKILALQPDLVLAFSDIQADIAANLIRRGVTVFTLNHRSVAEILEMVRLVGTLAGAAERAEDLARTLEGRVSAVRERAARLKRRPRVYFEEWDGPLISGISWVSELVEAAGGIDIFADRRSGSLAKERFVEPEEVIARAPDLIIGSWCGKRFRADKLVARPGFDRIPAVRNGDVYEIKSPLILQPGPAALTDGLEAIAGLVERWAAKAPV